MAQESKSEQAVPWLHHSWWKWAPVQGEHWFWSPADTHPLAAVSPLMASRDWPGHSMDIEFLLHLSLVWSQCALAALLALQRSDVVEKEISQFATEQVNTTSVTHLLVSNISPPFIFTWMYMHRQSQMLTWFMLV